MEISLNHQPEYSGLHCIARPRVGQALEQAAENPLVYVVAGAGYGKTQAVRGFIQQQEGARVYWVQLTESDNMASRFWENLTHVVASGNPALSAQMHGFGFPDTAARFKRFREAAAPFKINDGRKAFLVLDDFHVIHNRQLLLFLEQYVRLNLSNTCAILISRSEPEINMVSLFAKGKASIVDEDILRFTQDEIAAFLVHCGISVTPGSLSKIYKETHGWALAVRLLSMALRRMPGQQGRAIAAMKQNVFKLMESEAFADFSEESQKNLVKLAMVSHLPYTPFREDSEAVAFLNANPQMVPFVWFDSMIGDYRVHPLFAEFLQSKLYLLTEEEKEETYRWAAGWCEQNGYHIDAIDYYAKLRDYSRMMGIFLSYASKLPRDAVKYYLRILEGLLPLYEALVYPIQRYEDSMLITLTKVMIPFLLMELGRYDESREKLLRSVEKWEATLERIDDDRNKSFLVTNLFSNYNNLAYLNMRTCVTTHQYEFHEHFKKSMHFFKMSPYPPQIESGPFTCANIHSYACLVGVTAGRPMFDEFVAATREAVRYIPFIMNGLYGGYDDLAAAELSFFRNRPAEVKSFAQQAIAKARANKQYGIEIMAAQYLLRVSLLEGDYPLASEMLRQLKILEGVSDFWDRQPLYDIYTAVFYAQIGLAHLAAPWLTINAKDELWDYRGPAREQLVRARCLIASQRYYVALTALGQPLRGEETEEKLLLGELVRCLLRAIAFMKTGKAEDAVAEFEQAYRLSFSGEFEMPFIEFGKHMQELAALAARQADCVIDKAWLKLLSQKAAIYVKKADFVARLYKKERQIVEVVKLTEREHEVLNDLYHGLSRAEIAANRYLSINTVKSVLQTLYLKLGAENNVDAVRIALEMKLL
ncbi:MAG: LuxR C-terminal-related transcriptional regulator [Oscillospiraceae bacterium]|nr:LuxR C-terminal-related transcriptional regulator [Oscillospiraceae bacterium]